MNRISDTNEGVNKTTVAMRDSLVAPTAVSAETISVLEKRELKIRLIDAPLRDHLR